MMDRVHIFLLLIFCSVLIGCGTVQPVAVDYDPDRNRTVYRSQAFPVRIEAQNSGIGSTSPRLRIRLRADCAGRECHPETVELTLLTSSEGTELHIGERDFVFVADGERFTWEDPMYERRNRPERVVGMIVQVTMEIDQLQKVAGAETVEAYVGSRSLDVGGRGQQRFRAFLAEMGYGEDSA